MKSKYSVKNQDEKITISETDKYSPTHVKFNFSFITMNKDLSDEDASDLYKRIVELSSIPYLSFPNCKKTHFEFIETKFCKKKKICSEFENKSTHRMEQKKYCIFRLTKKDTSRVIGFFIRNIFYILFIDLDGELYNH